MPKTIVFSDITNTVTTNVTSNSQYNINCIDNGHLADTEELSSNSINTKNLKSRKLRKSNKLNRLIPDYVYDQFLANKSNKSTAEYINDWLIDYKVSLCTNRYRSCPILGINIEFQHEINSDSSDLNSWLYLTQFLQDNLELLDLDNKLPSPIIDSPIDDDTMTLTSELADDTQSEYTSQSGYSAQSEINIHSENKIKPICNCVRKKSFRY